MNPEIPGQPPGGEIVRNKIVASLIERSLVGELGWDFSRFYDPFEQYMATAEFNGVKYFSYNEQTSGIRLEAYKDGELVGRFSRQDVERLRQVLDQLSLEDPVAIEKRRQQIELDRQAEDRRRIKEADNLRRLREIQHGLERERR